jgi:hypothetical protein
MANPVSGPSNDDFYHGATNHDPYMVNLAGYLLGYFRGRQRR